MSSSATKKKATSGLCSLGSRCEPDYQVSVGLREQEGYGTSDSSSLDEKIAYSCVEARVFDCVYDRGTGEEELGDFEDSVLERATKKTKDRDADSSDTGVVSNVAIRLPNENHGPREGIDDRPEDQRTSVNQQIRDPSFELVEGLIAASPREVSYRSRYGVRL
ncbi:hypothetical protein SASPL_158006 [Salvia splendens]|uniref:Uncharacterized protein n=1 Tax=Salvia splendens TaxID=180675 RepID=A0A8X8VTZ1_SALSN|nr:hypothetical protein SASPL_158006 [Salvia splendens]